MLRPHAMVVFAHVVSGPGAQVPAAAVRGAGRPGARRADAGERDRARTASTTRSCSRARAASARPARRASWPRRCHCEKGPTADAVRHVRPVPGDRGRPLGRRHRDRRRVEHQASRTTQVDPRGRALPAGARAAQGLHHRRGAHALDAARSTRCSRRWRSRRRTWSSCSRPPRRTRSRTRSCRAASASTSS